MDLLFDRYYIRHKFRNDGKITWFLIVFFLPILGSALYLSTGKTRRVIFN
ncbi:PLDc N-terminal domain-containing protein [Maribacter litoralis]